MTSKIEWTEDTWNPVTGCTKISAGCKNCYAERMAKRLAGRFGYLKDDPFGVVLHSQDVIEKPLRRKKPTLYFVDSMGDLFHKDVPLDWIRLVFDVMEKCPQHFFLLLTKRADNMLDFMTGSSGGSTEFASQLHFTSKAEAKTQMRQYVKNNGWGRITWVK